MRYYPVKKGIELLLITDGSLIVIRYLMLPFTFKIKIFERMSKKVGDWAIREGICS